MECLFVPHRQTDKFRYFTVIAMFLLLHRRTSMVRTASLHKQLYSSVDSKVEQNHHQHVDRRLPNRPGLNRRCLAARFTPCVPVLKAVSRNRSRAEHLLIDKRPLRRGLPDVCDNPRAGRPPRA